MSSDPVNSGSPPESLDTDALVGRVYEELKDIARGFMRKERQGHTLQTTILVHEAFLRLRNDRSEWAHPDQFKATCALAIRRLLTDHARRVLAEKRGGDQSAITLDEGAEEFRALDPKSLLDIDIALVDLRKLDERQARVVELRFFGGMSVEETARAIGCSPRTVDGDWHAARAWLRRRLAESP